MNPIRGKGQLADVVICGAGPAGALAALVLAKAGCDVAVFDRARFPRRKVCGDCLNPSVWDVARRQGLETRLRSLPLQPLDSVEFAAPSGGRVRMTLPGCGTSQAECAVERCDFDLALIEAARDAGAQVLDGVAVESLCRHEGKWVATCAGGLRIEARAAIAADGRNSAAARGAGRLAPATPGRVAIQTVVDLPGNYRGAVALWCFREGYAGLAHLSGGRANLCLVGRPRHLAVLKRRVSARIAFDEQAEWLTIAPLDRRDSRPLAADGLYLVGDAARVVEPFTGEGTYYAMRTGELAGDAIVGWLAGSVLQRDAEREYVKRHAAVYRGRLWINRLARRAVLMPSIAETAVAVGARWPTVLSALTSQVVRPAQCAAVPG